MIKAGTFYLLSLMLGWAAFTPPAHAGIHSYPELSGVIVDEVIGILQKHGMPIKRDRGNDWFAWDGRPGHYTIKFYRSDEIPQAAILDTVKLCMDMYRKQGLEEKLHRIEILMYKESADEWRESRVLFGLLGELKPYTVMRIGEDE